MEKQKKEKMDEKNLVGLSEFIQKSLIAEMKFNNINMLTDVSIGKVKKLKLKRPLSSDPAVQVSILAYLEYYDVNVIFEY